MSEHTHNIPEDLNGYEPPAWLIRSLRLFRESAADDGRLAAADPPSEEFDRRCVEAARLAFVLKKLRAERQRVGFVPLPFNAYVEGLAKMVGVKLSPLLAWLGVDDLSGALPSARLAHTLGINLREALAHLRIQVAEGIDSAPMSLLLARHRAPEYRSKVEKCEEVLQMVEAEYDTRRLRELREAEFEFRAAYKSFEEDAG